jgi:hypothetical protein
MVAPSFVDVSAGANIGLARNDTEDLINTADLCHAEIIAKTIALSIG